MNCPNCHQVVRPGAAFCGNCGFQLAAAPSQSSHHANQQQNEQQTPQTQHPPHGHVPAHPSFVYNHNNGKAIAAFVLGMLGLIGWLIPLLGVILGLLALVFGTIAIHSQKRVFAMIGIALSIPVLALAIFFWVRNAQNIIKSRSNPLSGITTPSTSDTHQEISSPCYTTKIPASLTVSQSSGSCTFTALNQTSGEVYTVKVVQAPDVTSANLVAAAKADAANLIDRTPGTTIASNDITTFSGSPAYEVILNASDGTAGTLDYVYKNTIGGNLVIVLHTQHSGKNYGLADLETDWAW